jgi:uncharacterized protein involved in response to NO
MNRSVPLHGEIRSTTPPARFAIVRKGFRPFFLLASAFASAIVPLWLLVLFGFVRPTTYVDAATWHAHEMVFGYVVAVIAGFLLTAVGNWTQRETATGGKLVALAALWFAGRVAMLAPAALPRGLPALVDVAFLPALGAVLAGPLLATGNRRNYVMLAVLGVLSLANVAIHLDALGILAMGTGRMAAHVAIDVVVFLCAMIAGRVLPMFTRNATGAEGVESHRLLEIATVVALVGLVVVDLVAPGTRAAMVVAGIAGAVTLARASRWGTLHTGRHPLLWILHAGYGWLGVGLLLRGAPVLGLFVPPSLPLHAITVGAFGALTLGMMARVALGHTGRALQAPRAITVAFALVTLAALARVVGPLVAPATYGASLVIAGAAWTAAFAIYVIAYAPLLWSPRADGKPG